MKKKYSVLIVIIGCFLFPNLNAQKSSTSQEVLAVYDEPPGQDGFLGLSLAARYHSINETGSGWFQLPLEFTGASENYGLITHIMLISDLLHASEYFSGAASFISTKDIYSYSFFYLDIDRSEYTYKSISIFIGAGLGHSGFTSPAFNKSAHTFSVKIRTGATWFFHRHFAHALNFSFPFALYQGNMEKYRNFLSEYQLIYNYKGSVQNPSPSSFYLITGLGVEYLSLMNNDQPYKTLSWQPFIKGVILY